MPRRRTIFTDNAYYHVFNRGVEKRTIFLDDQDYQTFIDILTYYLKFTKKFPFNALTRTGLVHAGLFQDKIALIAYCLMPNHYHLLLHQKTNTPRAVSEFIHRVCVAYAMYFNARYQRAGSLFQGRFKAKHLDTDPYLLQSSKYIHRNPLNHTTRPGLASYKWSSYANYLAPNAGISQINRVTSPQPILDYFSQTNPNLSYQSFVEETELADWYQQNLKWLQ